MTPNNKQEWFTAHLIQVFIAASLAGDAEEVRQLIKLGVDVHANNDGFRRRKLLWALGNRGGARGRWC